MRSMALTKLFVALVVAIALTATESPAQRPDQSAVPAGLVGTKWRLVEFDGAAPEPDLPPVTLAFGPARAEGSGGCNWFSAWLEFTDGQRVAVPYLTATRRDCIHPRIMDLEARYLAALETLESYRLDGDRLVLASATSPNLAFRRE